MAAWRETPKSKNKLQTAFNDWLAAAIIVALCVIVVAFDIHV